MRSLGVAPLLVRNTTTIRNGSNLAAAHRFDLIELPNAFDTMWRELVGWWWTRASSKTLSALNLFSKGVLCVFVLSLKLD